MKVFSVLACAFVLSGNLCLGQAIEGAESLRDRNRILQKKNPVSSETSSFSSFNGLTASGDAEGVSQYDYLWSTSTSATKTTSINIFSRYTDINERFGLGARLQFSYPFDKDGKHAFGIDLGTNRFDRRFDSLQFLWDSSPREGSEVVLPNTARFDVRTLETKSRHIRMIGQTTLGKARLYAVGSRNEIDDMDERLRMEYKMSDLSDIDGSTFVYNKNRKRNSLRRSPDERIETVYAIGAEIDQSESLKLRAGAVTRSWERLRPGTYTIQFEDIQRTPVSLELSDLTHPVILDSVSQQDLANYEFLEIRFEDKTTNDSDDIAYAEIEWLGSTPDLRYTFSTGLIYREKNRDNYELRENYDSYAYPYQLDSVSADRSVGGFLDGAYELGRFPSEPLVLNHFRLNEDGYLYNATSSEQDSLSQNYDSYERVAGTYLNALLEMNEWSASLGLRYEETKIETFGYEVIANEDDTIDVSPESGRQRYDNVFPTISLSYQTSPTSNFLLSWQKTIARPDYYDLIPYQIIARSSEEIRSGNPNLSPTLLDTATLSWNRQIDKESSVRIALSSADIRDFIFSTEETIFEGPYEGFKFRSKYNGETARIYGVDFSLSRVFEPQLLAGKGITASILHQYRDSSADTGASAFQETPLPLVASNKSRLSLEQTVGKLYWLLQIDYSDKALDQFGPTLSTFEYLDQRLTTNARILYKIDQNWKARFDFINLGNASQNETIGILNRIGKITLDSWQCRMDLGRSW